MASTEDFGLSDIGRPRAAGYEESGQSSVYSRHSQAVDREHERVSLPRADGGKDAWLFLAGCFCIEALTWGKSYLRNCTVASAVFSPAFLVGLCCCSQSSNHLSEKLNMLDFLYVDNMPWAANLGGAKTICNHLGSPWIYITKYSHGRITHQLISFVESPR